MNRSIRHLLVALLLLAGCGTPGGPAAETTPAGGGEASPEEPAAAAETPPDGRQPTMQERIVIGRLSRIAERVRGLAFETRVHTEVQPREAIVRHLTRELEEEALESSRIVYVALGLLPPDLDVRAMLERVLGEQVVGYYDHEQDRLVIRDDVMRRLEQGGGGVDEARVTIVHELVHALQDQRLGLGERIEEDADTDAESAYQAVVEGDATLAMIGYVAQQAGGRLEWITRDPDRLRTLMAQTQAAPIPDAELRAAPAIVRETLMAAYLDGLVFAATLHGHGGWRAVDQAHEQPPVSTEQILHFEAYLSGELPDEVPMPDFAALAEAGLSVHEEDVLGELEMSIYLGQGKDDEVAEEAAAGWSGDRLRVYRDPEGGHPVVWFTAWDDAGEAAEAAAEARRIADSFAGPARGEHRVEREGRAVLIVRHLTPRLHAPVREAFREFARGLPAVPPRG